MKLLQALLYSGVIFALAYTCTLDPISKGYGYVLSAGILIGFIYETYKVWKGVKS